jgi:hypothetical protein
MRTRPPSVGSATEDGRAAAARRAPLEFVEKVSQLLNSTDTTEPNAMLRYPPRRFGRAGYWLRVALVVVAVTQRRLGPSSSATTPTTDRALPSSAAQARCWSRPTTMTPLPLLTTNPARENGLKSPESGSAQSDIEAT